METTDDGRVGVILAGGYSTRFGEQEKALAELDGKPLLVHVVEGLAVAVDGIFVNCRHDQIPAFRSVLAPLSTDVALVCDPTPDRGPAAGLATTLAAVATPKVAVVACDMPFVDGSFLASLFDAIDNAEAVVPSVDGHIQPMHAVYATGPTRRAAEAVAGEESGSLRDVLAELDVIEIPDSRVLEQTSLESFTDINTPALLKEITDE